MLSADGRLGAELGRRLGMAKAEFDILSRVWKHASLTVAKKLRVFEACVVSKLVYGMSAAFLNKAERRRLDGFQARCLRKILHIAPAYYSRVSNQEVLSKAGCRQVSSQVLQQQMILMGRVARGDLGTDARSMFFASGSCDLQPLPGKRCVGRPRKTWRDDVYEHSMLAAGGKEHLSNFFNPGPGVPQLWRSAVLKYIT